MNIGDALKDVMDLHGVVESELFDLYLTSLDLLPRGYNIAMAQQFSKLEKEVSELRDMIFEIRSKVLFG